MSIILLRLIRYGVFLSICIGDVKGNSDKWMSHVQVEFYMGFLLKGYDSNVGPRPSDLEPLDITSALSLTHILDVNEKTQIITTKCRIALRWTDYRLQWERSFSENNFTEIKIPLEKVWTPDINLINNVEVEMQTSDSKAKVTVYNNGTVQWMYSAVFKSPCNINVMYFPFDEQNCSLIFASSTYDATELKFKDKEGRGDVTSYSPHSEWSLVRVHAGSTEAYYSCCKEPFANLMYTVQIRRRPLFYVYNFIVPCFIITMMAVLSFYIPSQAGEKVSIGMTTLVSMTVFLMLVTEIMPPTSDVLPLLSLFYGSMILIVATVTALNAVTLNLHHKGNCRTNLYNARQIKVINPEESLVIHPDPPTLSSLTLEDEHESLEERRLKLESELLRNVQSISSSMKTLTDRLVPTEAVEETDQTDWARIASVLDRSFFFIFFLITIISSIGIILLAPLARELFLGI